MVRCARADWFVDRVSALRVVFYAVYCHEAGTYFRFHNLARALQRRGHVVTVRAGDFDSTAAARTEERDGVRYEILPVTRGARFFGRGSNPVTALRRVWNHPGSADVVHLFQPFLEPAIAWRRSARHARLACMDWDDLWTGGGAFSGPLRSVDHAWARATVWWLERTLPARADAVTTCSGFLEGRARERGARAVSVLPNGFWLEDAVPTRSAARAELGLRPDAAYGGFMGRTLGELAWCLDAFTANAERLPSLRLALCGMDERAIDGLPVSARSRTDFLGHVTPQKARVFAAALDLGLMPLEDTPFNQSRFPIKFAEYLGAGTPVLASAIGDCARRYGTLPGVLLAGTDRAAWNAAFAHAADLAAQGALPAVERAVVARQLGWDQIGEQLEAAYLAGLAR